MRPSPPLTSLLLLASCTGKSGVETALPDTGSGGPDTADSPAVACDARVPEDHASPADALAAAEEGSVVCVAAGTWAGDLDFGGREVMLVGAGAGLSVLSGDGDGPVVSFVSGEGPGAGLSGFTITGGKADYGAGVLVLEGATPTISELLVQGNTCAALEPTIRGVGVYAEGGTYTDLEVSGNTCALDPEGTTKIYGTGAYFRASASVDGLTVRENTGLAYEITGALVAKDLTGGLVRVSVHDNAAEATLACYGGGAHLSGTTSSASWLDIRGNRCRAGQEVRGAGLHAFVEGALKLTGVIVAGNVAEGALYVRGGGARLSGAVELVQADLVGNASVGATIEGGGVSLEGEGHVWRNVAVSGNTAEGSGEATEVHGQAATVNWTHCGWGETPTFGGGLSRPDAEDGHLFVDAGYLDITSPDPTGWDLGLAAGSAHIDAGDPALTDADGTRSDIGARGGAAW